MVEEGPLHTFYRVAKRDQPTDHEYLTPQDKLGSPPEDAPEDKKRSWDALSAFDTEDGARRQAKQFTHLGGKIARYDVPAGAGIAWEQSGEPGHFDLRGDKEELKHYLTVVVDV